MAAYYNNLAQVYAKWNKVDDAVTNYNKAAELDPAHAGGYLFNIGAVLTNAGKVDEAIVAFDKVIAADPTKAAAYYWKGVNLIGRVLLVRMARSSPPRGTAEAFQKYLELEPTGTFAQPAKDMLASIGAPVETGFGTKKKTVKIAVPWLAAIRCQLSGPWSLALATAFNWPVDLAEKGELRDYSCLQLPRSMTYLSFVPASFRATFRA